MILKNLSNGKTICKDLKACDSFLDRSLGLLRGGNPRNLMFKTRFGIHTFFLRDPIDVLIVDGRKRIIEVRQRLSPYRLFFWNPLFNILIELKDGTIKKYQIRKGDRLSIS